MPETIFTGWAAILKGHFAFFEVGLCAVRMTNCVTYCMTYYMTWSYLQKTHSFLMDKIKLIATEQGPSEEESFHHLKQHKSVKFNRGMTERCTAEFYMLFQPWTHCALCCY